MVSRTTSSALLAGALLLMFVIGFWLQPIPQPQAYHNFADQRSWFGIPNALNVLSNVFFALAGTWGLFLLLSPGKVQFKDERERFVWIGVSIGLILTAIGSAYYHLLPDNMRLVWDRLPMTIIFMSLVAALICERINVTFGLWLWPILLFVGFSSVLMWYASELQGIGDLRLYIGVQIFTVLVILIMLLTKSPYTRNLDLLFVVMFFGAARLFEIYDHQIYGFTKGIISGHTLKHVAAALAGAWLIRMIWKRKSLINGI